MFFLFCVGIVMSAELSSQSIDEQFAQLRAELQALRAQSEEQQNEIEALGAEQLELKGQLDRCGCTGSLRADDMNEEQLDENIEQEQTSEGDVEESQDVDGGHPYIVQVDIQNEAWVKEVFFGGMPWIVHCLDKRASVKQEVPEVFADSAFRISKMATFGTLFCWERLANGKTLAQRFRLPKPPVTFAVANGDPPLVLNLKNIVKPQQLKQKADLYLTAQVTEVHTVTRFKELCSKRKICLVVIFQTPDIRMSAVDLLMPLLDKRRNIRAIALDSTVWELRLDEWLLKRRSIVGNMRADLLCLMRGEGPKRSGNFIRAGDTLDQSEVSVFLDGCEQDKGTVFFKEMPWITRRKTKKAKSYKKSEL
eukprot:gnl/MRDRNA2_/MRDRNA2_48057_c0_seq1.p1 gnl/MRDRNA2_/MRDRNA2_48057_c0~~gnl/MRDRNA2_/MRDRNA2_48057_c0_seq1.p1  ORF type:complete len:365 (-),score=81.60 gnl/MRDRNA2_/MRDRNA2_48057_c0_seq1:164-1258(-)